MFRLAARAALSVAFVISPTIAQTTPTTSADLGNLVGNPGFEEGGKALPAQWEERVIGAPSEFAIDTTDTHGGKQSVRLTAKEVTRSYVRSAAIPVAPGERIKVSAWVKHKDVSADQGTVIAIAEFSRGERTKETFSKIGTAKLTGDGASGWQEIVGTVEVPAAANTLHLRLGFSYSLGTCWWDDVTVTALSPVVSRIDLSGPRVSPAMEGLPVEILNRDGSKGPVKLRVTLGKERVEKDIDLSANMIQRVNVPIKVTGRDAMELTAALFEGDQELAAEKRKVVVPKPLVQLPPIPTHWVAEDGNARVAGEVDLAVPKSQMEGATFTARIVDKAGAEKGAWSSIGQPIVDGVNPYSISSSALPVGNYKLVVELKPRRGEPIRAERDWSVIPRAKAKVTLNADGYPVYDGKPIFPLGVFNGGARMKEMGAAGFTVTHAYNSVEAETGGRLDDNRAMEFLDNSFANGMKAIMLVPRQLVFAENWDGVRRRVRMFRNHPGLLAWDEEEGLARGDIKIGTLARLRQVLREEDPNHPLMVGDAKDVIGRIEKTRSDFFPVEHMDLGMWWWYPIPLATNAKPAALEGDEGKPGTDELAPPSWLVNRNTDKPLWAGVQSYRKPKEGSRYPNPTEYRAQAYIALIHGAKGVMWYGGSVTGGAYLKPEESNWDHVKKLSVELNELAPVFMGKTEAMPTFSPADAPVSVMLKRADDRLVLFAVNRGGKPFDVTFDVPSIKGGKLKVLYENRDVAATTGKLTDAFEPYAVHVYELNAN